MVKKKSPVLLLTVVGVALAGAIVMNARGHQPDISQPPPQPQVQPGQAPAVETKDSIFGTPKPGGAATTSPPPTGKAPAKPIEQPPSMPKPGKGDVSGQWYRT
jgi:hypothetical protein